MSSVQSTTSSVRLVTLQRRLHANTRDVINMAAVVSQWAEPRPRVPDDVSRHVTVVAARHAYLHLQRRQSINDAGVDSRFRPGPVMPLGESLSV